MANIYDVASAIQQPNIVGNFNQGVQIGQQNQVFGQKQAAYQQALGDKQNIRALAPQVIAGDPNAYSQVAAIDPNEATQLQGAGDNQVRRFAGAINMLNQATKTNNPAAIDAAWQQARPYLSQIAGKPAPDHWDPSFQPGLDQAMAHIAQLPQQKSDLVNVAAGGAIFDPKTRQAIYSNPGVQKTPPIVSVNLPDGSTQQYQQNPDGSLAPLRLVPQGTQAAPQGQFQTSITPASPVNSGAADQANALLAQGMQPQEVMQRLVQANPDQQFQLAVDPATGQFKDVSDGSAQIPQDNAARASGQLGRSAPKVSAQDTFAKNKAFADQLRASGAITTPQEYNQVLTTGKLQQSDSDVALSPSDEAVAKGVATYAVLPSSLGRSKNRAAIIAHALELNPDYNEANAKGAYTYINDLSKSGTTSAGGQVQSINTGLNHLGTLMRANDELPAESSFPLINKAENALATGTGSKAVTNWNQASYLFSQEMAKLVKGGVANEGEVRDIVSHLNAAASPAQRNAAIQQAAEFMYGRIQAIEDRGDRVLGGMAPDVSLMTNEAQTNLRAAYKLGGRDLPQLRPPGDLRSYMRQLHAGGPSAEAPQPQSGEQGTAQSQSQQTPQAQPRAVNSMGHAVVWNGSAWVPE